MPQLTITVGPAPAGIALVGISKSMSVGVVIPSKSKVLTGNAANTGTGLLSPTGGDAGTGSGQLAAGHWVPAKGALQLIYPRPNAETNTYAAHRKAYYDATNAIQYRVPIGVRLGAPPYWFSLLAGPSGMAIGKVYGDANYGVVTWTPAGSVTNATVTVRVFDQDGSSLDVTWTVSTSSSTTDFIFVATTGNDSTGTGTISAPYASWLKLLGASDGVTTFPNRIVYFRSGTYNAPTNGQINPGKTPMSFFSYPGETVTINMQTTSTVVGFGTNSGTNDLTWCGFTMNSGNLSSGNYRGFWNGGISHRWRIENITITNPFNGTTGGDVTTAFFFDSAGTGTYRQYIYFRNCVETGRNGTGGNAYTLLATYVCQYVLVEWCTTSSSATQDMYLKASTRDSTVRYCDVTNSGAAGSGAALSTGCQVDSGLATANIEYCYNTIDAANYGALTLNYGYFSPGQHWAYRNSIRGRIWIRADGAGPYTLERNAIQNSTTDGGGNAQVSTQGAPNYTNTGTECQAASGVFDAGLLLTGTYRTNYLGLRGAEIA